MLLTPYRVLDLTHTHGVLCGQILADMGADVVQVEPPGGAHGRHLGPFIAGEPDPEQSLFWAAYARGKRSIELDMGLDRQTFLQLVQWADILIEAEPVGAMAAMGYTYDSLAAHNSQLIHVTITPFGDSGPKAQWQASDLTLLASAGPMAMTGDEDRAPVRVSVPQAWQHAGAEAAVGALVALHERHESGLGQQVVVSAQQALTLATQGYSLSAAVNETTAQRIAGGIRAGDVRIQLTYPALDGHVSITHIFGATVGPATRRLMEYVHDEGFCDAATRDKDWVAYGMLLATGEEPLEEFERVKQCVAACTRSKTKSELLEAALSRRLLLAPMTTIEDVAKSEQFAARDFFVTPNTTETAHRETTNPLAALRYPGAFAKFSATPLAATRPPPTIGEHTQDVLNEINNLTISSPGESSVPQTNTLPLAGVKILDFMWALAGPGATRTLADFGATVIRIESSTKLDVCRTIRPFIDGDESPEKSAVFHSTNAGKRLITLDLTNPAGREVALDLVRWADVVCESFSPRAMKAFKLDYPQLRKANPDLIMLSTCLMGQTGPLAPFAGYGNLAAAIAGFYNITGWPDREPAGPFGAYTDYIAPRYNALAILGALDHRRRHGEGQYIDLAQAEAAMHFLSPALLDYEANGTVQGRLGNRDLNYAPHGVYPVRGDDNYIAIACETDVHWWALCSQLFVHEPQLRHLGVHERREREDDLDQRISQFTVEQQGLDLEQRLQSAGVPAALVQNSPELLKDPQLTHLGHFVDLPHHEGGSTTIEASRIHLSRSSTAVDESAPTFARDMMFVLKEILDYDDDQIGELLISGVLE